MSSNLTHLLETCQKLLASNQDHQAERRKIRLDNATSTILILLPIGSIFAFILSAMYIFSIIYGLFKKRIPSRKYCVILSKSCADIFTSALIASASLFANQSSASHVILTMFLFVSTFGIVQVTGSYCALIVLRHISVTRPYGFASICSHRKMVVIVLFTWLLSIGYIASYSPIISVILNPEKENIVCQFSSCQRPLLVAAISIMAISLLTVLFSYIIVIAKMAQIAHNERMHNEPDITRQRLYRFIKFGSHLGLFSLITVLIFISSIYIIFNATDYNEVQRMLAMDCDVIDYIKLKMRIETIAGGGTLLWTVRIIFDCVIGVLLELRLVPWLQIDSTTLLIETPTTRHPNSWNNRCINCPVFNIDNSLHPSDFKN